MTKARSVVETDTARAALSMGSNMSAHSQGVKAKGPNRAITPTHPPFLEACAPGLARLDRSNPDARCDPCLCDDGQPLPQTR